MQRFKPLLRTVCLITLFICSTRALAADRPPNVVFIMADDMGYRDASCFGQDKFKTPNIDRLAAEGMKLTAMYSGNTVCAPSRCVLMSGKHPGHAYVRDNRQAPGFKLVEMEGQTPVPPKECGFPLTFQALNYEVGGFGKWGLGPWNTTGNPNQQGMDRFYGYICQFVAHNYYPAYLWDNGKQVMLDNTEYERPAVLEPGDDPQDDKSYARFHVGKDYAPDLITQQALDFLKANKDRPFFLYYPTTIPHLGYQVPDDSLKEFEGKFPEEPYPGSGNYIPVKDPRARYAAMITRMDREIGKLVALVQELGLDDNTIFVFTSDNGAPAGNPTSFFNSGYNFRGQKNSAYEGGFRVPAIVRFKGHIQPGTTSDRVVGFEDFFPTLLDLAGKKDATPDNVDGISFAPTLRGEQQPARTFLYREFPTHGGAQVVRVDDWRLVHHCGDNDKPYIVEDNDPKAEIKRMRHRMPGAPDPATWDQQEYELFDLKSDPSEMKNVAGEHPDIVSKLKVIMQQQHTPSELFPIRGVDPAKKNKSDKADSE